MGNSYRERNRKINDKLDELMDRPDELIKYIGEEIHAAECGYDRYGNWAYDKVPRAITEFLMDSILFGHIKYEEKKR